MTTEPASLHPSAERRGSEPTADLAALFTPKLVTVLREGYSPRHLGADVIAGLTVAIVALPLSMAIAVASGVTPERGLYAAVFGGFLVSALGGSRFQIGGPAGAFIVLVAATVQRHGVDGLLLATLISGVLLAGLGWLRLGTYIKFVPYPVTVGFTAGIAVIILASQVRDLLGLRLGGPEPGPILEKLPVLWAGLPTAIPAAVAVAGATIGLVLLVRRLRPRWPAMLIAMAATAVGSALLSLPVETIGSRFGGLPAGLPMPALPPISPGAIVAVLPDAIAFALLGGIESLLSAVVADGMTGRRHRSNCELVGQGVANIASALFGGLCVTGTIARTATNVRAGAHGPVAGMAHSLFVLGFLLVAAPLARYVPLATLAGILAVVAWTMAEKHAAAALLRSGRGEAAVLVVTFALTVLRDLTEAIVVGVALGALLIIHRLSAATAVESTVPPVEEDRADTEGAARTPYEPGPGAAGEIAIHRIRGAFFFGAAAAVGTLLERLPGRPKALIVDFADVPFIDATAAKTIDGLLDKAARRGVAVTLTGTTPAMRRLLVGQGLKPPRVVYKRTVEDAVAAAQARLTDG
ncbi:MAG: SulP family inorganic anion transporter [Azospirillaceae bacterium]